MIPIEIFASPSIQKTVEILKNGGIIAHPADTCYGLAGIFGDPKALKNLQVLKGRDGQKPMSLMLPLSHKDEIGQYAALDEFSRAVCQALFPGPVTLILPKGTLIPAWHFPETTTIGIRIPADENSQALLEALRKPIITTSANLSAEPLCQTAEEIQNSFSKRSDLLKMILESPAPLPQTPSTVILIESGKIKILREGPWSLKDIEEKIDKNLN